MKNTSRIAGGIASSVILALMPKCPLCVAAYIAMLTGIGISVAMAAIIKTTMAALCALVLFWLSITTLLRWAGKNRKCAVSECCKANMAEERNQAINPGGN